MNAFFGGFTAWIGNLPILVGAGNIVIDNDSLMWILFQYYTVFWYSKGSNKNNSSIDTFNFHNTSSLPGNENSILIFVTTWNSFDLQLHLTYLLTNTTDNSAVFRMFSGLKKKNLLND